LTNKQNWQNIFWPSGSKPDAPEIKAVEEWKRSSWFTIGNFDCHDETFIAYEKITDLTLDTNYTLFSILRDNIAFDNLSN
jgi:hypothetical protein